MKGRLRRWALSLGIIGIASVTCLVAMEMLVRWKFPQPTGLSHQDRYGLALHWPGITRHLPQFGHSISFNSAGMRDREHAVEKTPGTFRVLVLGDSFMEAYQVPFESSFPPLLESALAERVGRPVEVINAGVSGWGTDDELRYYSEYARKMRPDLVVVAMTLHNDIQDNLRQTWHTEREGRLEPRDREPFTWYEYQKIRVKGYLATRFQLYQLWRIVRHRGAIRQTATQLRSHVETLFDEPPQGPTARGFRLTELMLARLDSVVTSDGGQLAIVLLPLRMQLSDADFSRFTSGFEVPSDSVRLDHPQWLMQGIAARLGLPIVDLLPGFRAWTQNGGAPVFLERDGHWNEQGHRLARDLVAEALVASDVVPASAPVAGVR